MEVLTTSESLPRLAEKLAATDEVGLDYETTSFHPMPKAALQFDRLKAVGWGFGFPDGTSTYVPIAHQAGTNVDATEAIDLLTKVLTDPSKVVWAHNAKFESTVTRVLRIDAKCEWRCSMIAQWLLGKGFRGGRKGHKLKPAVETYLKHKMLTWEEVIPAKARAHMVSPSTMAPYCADDALQGMRLGNLFLEEIQQLGMEKVYLELENPIAAEVLPHMDEVGAAIDRDFLRDIYDIYTREMKQLDIQFRKLTGVGVGKDAQISVQLYDKLQWWPVLDHFKRGKSGRVSVDAKHRAMVEKELRKKGEHKADTPGFAAIALKDRYQRLSKIASTYTLALIKRADRYVDGRIRSSWRQHGTETGRFASRDPNLQNIPIRTPEGRRIREAFVHGEGWSLYDADYSGADLRVFAHLCQDRMMIEKFNSDDDDLHQQTADLCGVSRPDGKTANLGLIYEMGPGTLAANIEQPFFVAKRLWQKWHQTYPAVRRFHKKMHAYARTHGFVRTLTGRIRYIEGIDSNVGRVRSWAEHESTNTPAQGSVADIIKIAMRNLIREWKDRGVLYDYYTGEGKAKMTIQVHDELLLELRDDFKEEGAADVRRHMEQAVELRVPLATDGGFGSNWLEAH